MPGRNHVASAVLAASASRSGAASVSPLVQSYQQFDVNRPYGPALPRTPDAFTSGMFGPLSPIVPMVIDKPREDSGRPAPRRWQYPVGWNLPVGTPGTEGIKMTTFATLRSLADMYSVVRTCIDKRIAELVALDWDIVPTAEADRAMRGDSDKRTDWDKRRAQVIDFFTSPDSDRAKYPTFESWLSALLEDLFVLDAVALHLHPPRRPNSGPFHSDLASLDLLDGSTIRPLLNMHGSTPRPPDVAYQQYIWGVPRVDLSSVVQGVDVEGMTDQKVAEYRADQLMYLRFKARNWTPYGFSPVEASLLPISIGLARQQFQWDYFQDGSIPGQFVVPGDSVTTPQQIRELQDALNALAGDIGAKHRIIVLPPGSKADAQKSPELTDQFDEWVLSLVTMLFQLTPMDIGITPRARAMMSPEGGRQMAMTNSTQGNQTRVKPITTWLKAVLFDYIIQNVFGQDDMEWSWGITATGENAEQELDMTVQKVQNGILSIDEARISQGEAPWGLPESSVPIVWTGTGPVLLSSIGQAAAQPAIPGDVRHQITAPKPANPGPKLPMPLAANPEDEGTPAHTAATRLPNTAGPHPEPAKDTAETDKAILQAELQKLTRYLRKGKPIDRFVSKVLTDQQLQQGQQPADNGDTAAAVAAVAAAALIAQSVARRAAAVSSVATQVADTIGQLVNRYRNGDIAYPTAVDQGVAALTDGYRTSMADGTRHAADDSGLAVININHEAETRGEAQRGYITRLLGAGDAATPARLEAMASRFDLYGATLTGAYNSAYGTTIRQGAPDRRIVWRLGETEHCPLCLARDKEEYTFDTLPGWPGDGGFGGPLCEGGPSCGCWLEFVENNQTVDIGTNTQRPDSVQYYAEQNDRIASARAQAAEDRRRFLSTIPGDAAARAAARDDVRQQLSAIANRMIRQSGGYPGVTVEPTDIPADLVAALSKSGDNPAEVAFEASLIASVPEDDWEWIGKLWDPDLHPRDVRGRFASPGGEVSHAEREARTRAPDVVDTRSRRQHRRDLEDAFGGHHDTGETIRPDTAQLPTDRAMAPTEHVEAATGDRDRFVSVKALADQARRSNLYTDEQVRVALAKLEQLRHEAETDRNAERRRKALIGIGAILAGFLVAVFLSPLIAAAPLAIAAVVDHLPEATKVAVEFHRRR